MANDSTNHNDNPGAFETVVSRNYFYNDNYYRMLGISLWLLLIIALLVGFLFYQQSTRPTPKYFATNTEGALIELTPLEQPNLSTNTLLEWATEAATNSYTFNFVNYRQAFQNARQYFTAEGYTKFLNALEDSRNLEAVKTKKLVVSAIPSNVPIIVNEGMLGSRYAWRVEVPMLIAYQSASELIRQNIKLTLLIVRVPTLEAEKGVGITQFIVENMR